MDGVHDLGGKPGFGAVDFVPATTSYVSTTREAIGASTNTNTNTNTNTASQHLSAAPFVERWHASVFAMVGAASMAGVWTNTDRFRHSVERIHPEAYLNHGYYGRWLGGLETLLEEQSVVLREEVDRKVAALGGAADALVAARPSLYPDPLGPAPTNHNSDRLVTQAPIFSVGQTVSTQADPTSGHTRLPAYARDKQGVVVRCHNAWVYPDTNAHGLGEQPTHLYTVEFTSETLWGRTGFSVFLDLFEPYLILSGS